MLMFIMRFLLAAALAATAYSQTEVNLRTQGRDVDFTGASSTRPVRMGIALPATCAAGELFFNAASAPGSNLYACASANQWVLQGGGGSLSVSEAGNLVGSRTAINLTGGFGQLDAVSDTGTQINIQQGVDTSVIPSKADIQKGTVLLCSSASGSGNNYTCAMSPTLQGYAAGMVLHWLPDVAGTGGTTTLNVDTLGAVPLVHADGTTSPVAGDIAAGNLYTIWYDGAVFRLPKSAGAGVTAGSDGQVYSTDSNAVSNPVFEYTPYLPLPGIADPAWSSFGTTNGTTAHTQITPGGRVSLTLSGSNTPEVHGRYIPVSSSSDFTHIIATIPSFSGSYSGIEAGAFFTDGSRAATCGLHGSSGTGGETLVGYGITASTGSQTAYTVAAARQWPAWFTGPVYWKLSWARSSTTMSCSVSNDGYTWSLVWTDSTPYLTPGGVGYYLYNDYGTDFNSYVIAWGYR